MKRLLQFSVACMFLVCTAVVAVAQSGNPLLKQVELVAQLPPELPQRLIGFAYDGDKFLATVYLGKGRYATLDPATRNWDIENKPEQQKLIATVAGAFASPGGICFAERKLWVMGAYGESFGSIDLESSKISAMFKGKQREDAASQFYSSAAWDGNNLWIAWHWFRYDLPASETQLLLKVDPESGKVIALFSLPGGTQNDGTHALTWDGRRLWHMKDRLLSSIDPTTGAIINNYQLPMMRRPSGMAWAHDALWIAEFEGKVWRLPFEK